MTNDAGRRQERPEALFRSTQDGDCRATVAWRAAGPGGARDECPDRSRLSEWRDRALTGAATALKERARDDRDDEIARLKAKVGEITMDNELLYAKIATMEGKRPLAHRRSRRSAAHSRLPLLAVMVSRELHACGRSRAPASMLSQSPRLRSPVALVRSAHVRTRNWQIISAGK